MAFDHGFQPKIMADATVAVAQIRATMMSNTLIPEAPVQCVRKTPNVKIVATESQTEIVAIVRAELSPISLVIAVPSLLTHGTTKPSTPSIKKPVPTPEVIDAVRC